MLKEFLKNSGIYSVSNLLSRGIAFILVPFYTRVLTPADYGIIDFIAVIAMIAGTVFPLEITQAVGRLFPDAKEPAKRQIIASNALYFSVFTLGIFLLGIELFAKPLGTWLYEDADPYAWRVVQAAGVSIFAMKLFYVFQVQLQASIKPIKHALSSIAFSVISLSLNVVFILIMKTGVIGVFWAQSIAGAVASLIAYSFSRENYVFKLNLPMLREMLAYSLPLVPSGVGLFFLSYVDRIFIKSMLSLSELGLYGIGFRVASLVSVLMAGMITALTPLIYASFRDDKTRDELARIFRLFLFVAVLVTGFLSLFGLEMLMLLTTPAYYGAAIVIPSLVVSTFLSQMYIFTPGLGIARKTGYLATINIAGGVINVILNWVLLQWLGILGAALATLFSYMLIFSINMYFSQKFYHVPHSPIILLRALLFATLLIAVGYQLQLGSFWYTLGAKSVVFMFLPVLLIVNRLVRADEIKDFFTTLVRHLRPGQGG
ncbi:MAG: oligosaccharide flippase family protein [Calditrichia bacterium]